MNESYIEFEISEPARFDRLVQVVEALRQAKLSGDFRDDQYWLGFFDEMAQSHFWWPTEEELNEWKRRWDATPVLQRSTDPSLERPWHFGSMIDAIREGEYELVRCSQVSDSVGRLEFRPRADPFGGEDALHTLIESFGFRVLRESGT